MNQESIPQTKDPRVIIEEIRNRTMLMGNSDSENDSFNSILKDLSRSKINPEEAIAKAQAILDSKQRQ